MKLPPWCAIGLWALAATSGAAGVRLPVEDFCRAPDTRGARLSPDGKYLAFLRDTGSLTRLHVLEIESGELSRINLGQAVLADGARKDVTGFEWVGDRRIVVNTAVWDVPYGVVAMNLDGSQLRPISGYEDERSRIGGPSRLFAREVIHRFYDKNQQVLMLDRHEGGPGSYNRPDVIKVGTLNGTTSVEVKNPGEVSAWGVDSAGVVRLGILSHGELSGAIYRESGQAAWRTVLALQNRGPAALRPVGFDAAGGRVLVAALTPERRWTVFPLDPATGAVGEALLADPEYDILPEGFTPRIDGMALCAPIFSRGRDALLGVRYVTEAPRVKWFDREMAVYQKAVDRALPDTVNLLVDMSVDGKRMLWFGYSDQNPGVYLLLDGAKKSFKPIERRMGWIDPARMAPMLAVTYPARDGLTIHGFLTVPVGRAAKGMPLVVMPHGGPWVRDVWNFDPMVQLLANRGYAVLQMNYRGSPGYGDALVRAARREVGGKIQDDIEDATRWAIAAGVADPQRIAIMGGSYGGYSALFALGRNPELYRCGISFAGVTDWLEIFDDRTSDPDYRAANRHWRREIGDPGREPERERLRSISPVNFADRITAPVLIVQGKNDRTVPSGQAKLMIKALEKAGRKPQSLFIAGQGHSLTEEKARLEYAKAVVAFLEQHLGPGVD